MNHIYELYSRKNGVPRRNFVFFDFVFVFRFRNSNSLLLLLLSLTLDSITKQRTMALEIIYIAWKQLLEVVDAEQGPDLSSEDRQRRDRRTPRVAIRRYSESSFYYLFNSGNDQALLNCCAVDHKVFRELLGMFKPVYDKFTVDDESGLIREVNFTRTGQPKGRQRELDAVGAQNLL